jgi:hypothetical protein
VRASASEVQGTAVSVNAVARVRVWRPTHAEAEWGAPEADGHVTGAVAGLNKNYASRRCSVLLLDVTDDKPKGVWRIPVYTCVRM